MNSSKESSTANDEFTLYNLRVEIDPRSQNIIGKHEIGDYFDVIGEDIFFPEGHGFPLYALASILPLLPAKQRQNHPSDFMETDGLIADPDANSGAVYRITRTGTTVFKHSDVSAEALPSSPLNHEKI